MVSEGEQAAREERFCQLFAAAYPVLRRYANNRGLRGPDAEDLVARTLEVAWVRLEQVPGIEPIPWLFAVAQNLLRNDWRTEARRARLSTLLPPGRPAFDSTEEAVVGPGTIRWALEQLEPGDQEILRLVAWDELTASQVARVLGCSSVAARSRLHRARKRLDAVLNSEPPVQHEAELRQRQSDRENTTSPTEVP